MLPPVSQSFLQICRVGLQGIHTFGVASSAPSWDLDQSQAVRLCDKQHLMAGRETPKYSEWLLNKRTMQQLLLWWTWFQLQLFPGVNGCTLPRGVKAVLFPHQQVCCFQMVLFFWSKRLWTLCTWARGFWEDCDELLPPKLVLERKLEAEGETGCGIHLQTWSHTKSEGCCTRDLSETL